jgi:hypothetical protein
MITTTNKSGARTSGVTCYSWSLAQMGYPTCSKAMTEPCGSTPSPERI